MCDACVSICNAFRSFILYVDSLSKAKITSSDVMLVFLFFFLSLCLILHMHNAIEIRYSACPNRVMQMCMWSDKSGLPHTLLFSLSFSRHEFYATLDVVVLVTITPLIKHYIACRFSPSKRLAWIFAFALAASALSSCCSLC